MSKSNYIIILLVGVIAFLLFIRGCDRPDTETESKTKIDTFYLPGKDKIHELPAKTPEPIYIEVPIITEIPSIVDTAKILREYFTKNFYSDSTKNDSVVVYYKAEVTMNILKSMKQSYRLTLPQMVIKESTTITTMQSRQLAFIGVDLTSNGANLGFYPSIYFDTRKAMFGAGYDPLNKAVKVGVYTKLKLWKKR